MELYIVLLATFAFLVVMVGGYVFMFLHIMRNDPREIEFRESFGIGKDLIPKKHTLG